MKKYWRFYKQSIQGRLAYRGDMIIYSFASAFTPVLALGLWLTTSQFSTLPFSQAELIAYFVGAICIGIITEQWQAWFIAEDIADGFFSFNLIKPFSFIIARLMEKLADVTFKLSMVTIGLVAAFFIFNLSGFQSLNISPVSILLFTTALIGGFFIVYIQEIMIGLAAAWFYDINFLKGYMDTLGQIGSGRFVPLAFLPPLIGAIAIWLPFRYTVSFPLELLLGKLTTSDILLGFAIEAGWLIISFVGYLILFKAFTKKYQGFGG